MKELWGNHAKTYRLCLVYSLLGDLCCSVIDGQFSVEPSNLYLLCCNLCCS